MFQQVKNDFTPFSWYTCAIMTKHKHILIILKYFESVSIWALFGPETAVTRGKENPRIYFTALAMMEFNPYMLKHSSTTKVNVNVLKKAGCSPRNAFQTYLAFPAAEIMGGWHELITKAYSKLFFYCSYT